MRLRSPFRSPIQRTPRAEVVETRPRASQPEPRGPEPGRVQRTGFAYGVEPGGLDEHNASVGASTQTDRRTVLQELWEAYLTCPWAWACVNAIARTVTAGGLTIQWDPGDDDRPAGQRKAPAKPAQVKALERLIAFCNPTQDIRQLLRNVVADLQVFGDAYIEVVWMAGLPVALFNLDCPSTTPIADEHGQVTAYVQVTEYGQRAHFEPREVIHISLDSARPGVFGVSPTHAALTPIKAWLFAAGLGKNMYRRGLPPTVHMDFPAAAADGDVRKWAQEYVTDNLGVHNVGNPLTSRGGASSKELQARKITDVISGKDQSRDEIVSSYGVPPAKVGIIESGNLGGGTHSGQDKTYRLDTCGPVGEIILEKLQFHLAAQGFGVPPGWLMRFGEVDYRDDETVEKIRDMRLRSGAWTLNKYRAVIGEPPVPGGDDAVLVERTTIVAWKDMETMSRAMITFRDRGGSPYGMSPAGRPAIAAGKPGGKAAAGKPDGKNGAGKNAAGGKNGTGENAAGGETLPAVQEAAYRARLHELITAMPATETTTGPSQRKLRKRIRKQLSSDFPPEATAWVKQARWDPPRWVPRGQVDTSDEHSWAAWHDRKKVKKFRKKIRKQLAKGGHPKPAILVHTPGSDTAMIADGHHHALAEMELGYGVWAVTAHVTSARGPWDEMHAYQDHHLHGH